jgi:hypothetical protein
VLSDPAREGILIEVTGDLAERVRAGIREALGSGVICGDGRGVLSFRHVLAGRAIYEAVPVTERRMLHLRAARAIEKVSPLPVARLARHFREAGETNEWCRYAEQAADIAIAAGDDAAANALLHDLLTGAHAIAEIHFDGIGDWVVRPMSGRRSRWSRSGCCRRCRWRLRGGLPVPRAVR